MRFVVLAVLAFVTAANAFAVAPQFWRVRSAEDLLAGEIDGFAVTSRGQLKAAPSVRKVATFTDRKKTATGAGDIKQKRLARPRQDL